MKPNIPLLTEIQDWVQVEAARKKANKQRRSRMPQNGPRWNQRHWIANTDCGTAYCVAGYAATRNGERPVFEDSTSYSIVVELPDGTIKSIRQHATHTLGISRDQASRLFNPENSARRVISIIESIKEGASR